VNTFLESRRVLIVDDNPADRDFVRAALRQEWSELPEISEAFSVAMAVDKLRAEERFDLVLLDLELSGSKGVSAVCEIRKAAPETPIVVLTGNFDKELVLQVGRIHSSCVCVRDRAASHQQGKQDSLG